MRETIFENKVFRGNDLVENSLAKGEYDNCSFIACNISDADFSNFTFVECIFDNCNLSNTKLKNTTLNDVRFTNCKLLGLIFSDINDLILSLDFKDCLLNFSSFYKLKLKAIKFINCSLQEVDFTETELINSVFENCDLSGAIFDQSHLQKADFLTSYNFSIDPNLNRIDKAKFSLSGLPGLLYKFDIEVE